MVNLFPCFTGSKMQTKQINLSKELKQEENVQQSSEELEDRATTSLSWPWLHLDYKGNTDLVSPDIQLLNKLRIPERDVRLILSSQVRNCLSAFWIGSS